MAIRGSRDESETGLASLQTYDIDPQKVERIRARCLAALDLQRRRSRGKRSLLAGWRRWFEPAAAFGLSAIYLAVAVTSSLALLR